METEIASQLLAQMAELKAAVASESSHWSRFGAPAISAFFGFIVAFVSGAALERRREKRLTATLRAALLAEISAMAEVIRGRGYIEALQEGVRGDRDTLRANIPDDYFTIFKSNTDKIGHLNPVEAARIVRLYHLVESVAQDVKPGGVLYDGSGGRIVYQQGVEFLETALNIADELVSETKRKSRS
ncbi:hypothetical protein LG331_09325 [Vreelandella aquamarina]|uniref:hypothetical protein n=1 Tax=Vreelandella aquamarina TaxID=77097 RepID=UPI0038507E2F